MKYLSIIVFLLMTLSSSAQKSVEVGLVVGGTNSIVTPSFNDFTDFDYDQHISFAIFGNYYFSEKTFFSSGIRYQPLGARSKAPIDGTDEIITLHWNAYAIGIPAMIGYKLLTTKKFGISIELGIFNGFIANQNLTTDRSSQKIEVYSDFITSASVSLGLNIKLNEEINFILRPNFQFQLNKNNTDAFIVNNSKSKLMYYGFDIGVSTKLKKKDDNKR